MGRACKCCGQEPGSCGGFCNCINKLTRNQEDDYDYTIVICNQESGNIGDYDIFLSNPYPLWLADTYDYCLDSASQEHTVLKGTDVCDNENIEYQHIGEFLCENSCSSTIITTNESMISEIRRLCPDINSCCFTGDDINIINISKEIFKGCDVALNCFDKARFANCLKLVLKNPDDKTSFNYMTIQVWRKINRNPDQAEENNICKIAGLFRDFAPSTDIIRMAIVQECCFCQCEPPENFIGPGPDATPVNKVSCWSDVTSNFSQSFAGSSSIKQLITPTFEVQRTSSLNYNSSVSSSFELSGFSGYSLESSRLKCNNWRQAPFYAGCRHTFYYPGHYWNPYCREITECESGSYCKHTNENDCFNYINIESKEISGSISLAMSNEFDSFSFGFPTQGGNITLGETRRSSLSFTYDISGQYIILGSDGGVNVRCILRMDLSSSSSSSYWRNYGTNVNPDFDFDNESSNENHVPLANCVVLSFYPLSHCQSSYVYPYSGALNYYGLGGSSPNGTCNCVDMDDDDFFYSYQSRPSFFMDLFIYYALLATNDYPYTPHPPDYYCPPPEWTGYENEIIITPGTCCKDFPEDISAHSENNPCSGSKSRYDIRQNVPGRPDEYFGGPGSFREINFFLEWNESPFSSSFNVRSQ